MQVGRSFPADVKNHMKLIELIKHECTLGDEFGTSLVFNKDIMDLVINYRGRYVGFFSLYLEGELESGIESLIELVLRDWSELEGEGWLSILLKFGLSLDFAGIPHSTMVYLDGLYIVEEDFEKVGEFENLKDALERFKAGHQKWFDTPLPSQGDVVI